MENKTHDLSHGNIGKELWSVAWPMMLSMFFYTLYNFVDAYWVSKLSAEAIAAVSISQITLFVMISLGFGLIVGSGVIMAMHIGAENKPEAERVLGQSFVLSAILAAFFTIVALTFKEPFLIASGATGDIFKPAMDYYTITAGGSILMFTLMTIMFAFNSQGDTSTLTKLFAISTGINLILDPLLIFGCKNCFGCVGLYQKQYCMFNEQLTKEEFENRLKQLDLSNPVHKEAVYTRLESLKGKVPVLGVHKFQTEDCVGDSLTECKGSYQCYDAFVLEYCNYNIECNGNTNSTDLTVCFEVEWCYSCVQAPINHNCNFLMHTDQCSDSEFCAYSKNLKNCFGCVYLANKEYHILNEPYSPEEYEKKVAEIKQELMSQRLHNMSLYLVSDYEQKRFQSEDDSVIQSILKI
jgi:hypothetical protein